MNRSTRLIARIALFSALIYVLSWSTALLPNVNFAFLIAFTAGYFWGAIPGILVGSVGMWLWTSFNPFGPAPLPIAVVQVVGLATCGLIGFLSRHLIDDSRIGRSRLVLLLAALLCTLAFYLPVSLVDAWLFQPFWPRLITGLSFMGISLISNMILFPLSLAVILRIRKRERLV
ncbi:MAG: hypothetical protein J7J98_01755 [candidate division Zixibacteria bacterium]|nr:hypothetical protein [candidate division Zixibacteria bacterium]